MGTAQIMNDETVKPLDELMEPGSTLMVATASDPDLEFRPLTAAAVSGDRIEILLDTSEPWAKALKPGDTAHVTMSDTKKNTWLSLKGTTSYTTDPAAIDALWNPFAAAYFDNGRDTPGITVMRIDGDAGHYWSSPSGRIGSLISMVKAKVGSPETSGDHGDISL